MGRIAESVELRIQRVENERRTEIIFRYGREIATSKTPRDDALLCDFRLIQQIRF